MFTQFIKPKAWFPPPHPMHEDGPSFQSRDPVLSCSQVSPERRIPLLCFILLCPLLEWLTGAAWSHVLPLGYYGHES